MIARCHCLLPIEPSPSIDSNSPLGLIALAVRFPLPRILHWLCSAVLLAGVLLGNLQADWDFFNMEFSTAEFIAGNKKKKTELRVFILDWLKKNSHTKLMGRQHVVRHENEAGHKRKDFVWDSATAALDKERGVLSHTVMFYSMTEPHAPVYENINQRHMFNFLLQQMKGTKSNEEFLVAMNS